MPATTRTDAVRKHRLVLALVVVTMLSACAGVDNAASPSTAASQAAASALPVTSPSEASDLVTGPFPVDDGRQLNLECLG